MKGSLYMLDQFRDVVQGKPRPEVAEIAHRYLEGLPRAAGAFVRQPAPERFIDDLAERPAGAARLRLQFSRNVVVQSESGSHAVML